MNEKFYTQSQAVRYLVNPFNLFFSTPYHLLAPLFSLQQLFAAVLLLGKLPYSQGEDEPGLGSRKLQIILASMCKPYSDLQSLVQFTSIWTSRDRSEVDAQHREERYPNREQLPNITFSLRYISLGASLAK